VSRLLDKMLTRQAEALRLDVAERRQERREAARTFGSADAGRGQRPDQNGAPLEPRIGG
jgi:hypothetical protein